MRVHCLEVGDLLTNCYFISSDKELLVVDPGANPEKIIKALEETGKKIKKIILTHYHFDHNQAAEEIRKRFNSAILIHTDDRDFLKEGGIVADRSVKDKDEIEINGKILKVIHTPGHTEGSICLLGENFIITGDTLFENGYGRTDLPGGSPDKMKKSLERLRRKIKPGMHLYPGHGESFKFF